MVKNLPELIFIFLSFASTAQNYRSVAAGQERYFIDPTGYIRAANVYPTDTIGNDTIFKNFYAVEEDPAHCPPPENYFESYNVYGSSWLGRKIDIDINGINRFYNSSYDTITLNVEALLGSTWPAFTFSNGSYFEATVISVSLMNVLGNLDSVKTISLQAKDASNVPLSHFFNGKKLQIGKETGFIKIYNLLNFPFDTTEYFISDKSRMTRGDVYGYNIGDVVQLKKTYGAYNSDIDTVHYTTRTILDKISPDASTLTYTIKKEHLIYRAHYDYQNHISIPLDTLIYTDTIIVTYNNITDPIINGMPEESTFNYLPGAYTLKSKPTLYNGRKVMENEWDPSCNNPENDTCFHRCGFCDVNQETYTYIEGLGDLLNGGAFSYGLSEKIIYYQLGNENYGELFTAVNENKIPDLKLNIYPNPSNDVITIEYQQAVGSKQLAVTITDITGKELLRSTLIDQKSTLDISALIQGIYFITISDGEQTVNRKIIKQ